MTTISIKKKTTTSVLLQERYQLDLELAIETKRILNVLDRTIGRLEMIMCLPILLDNNASILKPHLSSEEMAIVMSFSSYSAQGSHKVIGKTESQDSIEAVMALGIDEIRNKILYQKSNNKSHAALPVIPKTEQTLKSSEDLQIYRVVSLLCSKPILSLIKDQLFSQISPAAEIFFDYIHQLRACTLKRLSISSHQERSYEQVLRQLWQQNEQARADITVLRTNLEIQRNRGNAQLTEKNLLINKHREKIERLKKCSKDDIKKRINESECAMELDRKDSEYRLGNLQTEVKESQMKLSEMLTQHLCDEKQLKDKRYEVESVFVVQLAKYDTDMGQRQKEWEEINAEYNEQKQQMIQLQEQFNIQETEYDTLMAEKAAEKRQELETRLFIFLMGQSAKKIQRYWRAYRVRKLAKRKGRRKPKRDSGKGTGNKDSNKKKK